MESRADHETDANNAVEPAGAKGGAPTPADTTTAVRGIAPELISWTSAATGAAAALAELVKQTEELQHWTARQISASSEMTGTPSAPHAQPKRDEAGEGGQQEESTVPTDRAIHAEKAAAKAGDRPDEQPEKATAIPGVKPEGQPTKDGLGEKHPDGLRQDIPSGQVPPEEWADNGVRPELPGAGRELQNRFDAAQGRIRNQTESSGELQALLDQAITLLETVSQHPAIRDYSANQRRLEEIEQRLGYGAYPQ